MPVDNRNSSSGISVEVTHDENLRNSASGVNASYIYELKKRLSAAGIDVSTIFTPRLFNSTAGIMIEYILTEPDVILLKPGIINVAGQEMNIASRGIVNCKRPARKLIAG